MRLPRILPLCGLLLLVPDLAAAPSQPPKALQKGGSGAPQFPIRFSEDGKTIVIDRPVPEHVSQNTWRLTFPLRMEVALRRRTVEKDGRLVMQGSARREVSSGDLVISGLAVEGLYLEGFSGDKKIDLGKRLNEKLPPEIVIPMAEIRERMGGEDKLPPELRSRLPAPPERRAPGLKDEPAARPAPAVEPAPEPQSETPAPPSPPSAAPPQAAPPPAAAPPQKQTRAGPPPKKPAAQSPPAEAAPPPAAAPAPAHTQNPVAVAVPAPVPAPRPETLAVPPGLRIPARMAQEVDTRIQKAGDRFELTVTADVFCDGRLVIPAGARVRAAIARVEDNPLPAVVTRMVWSLEGIVLPDGTQVHPPLKLVSVQADRVRVSPGVENEVSVERRVIRARNQDVKVPQGSTVELEIKSATRLPAAR